VNGKTSARRIAVFADLHGNPYACEAVLNAIQKEGACETIVAAGDLCLGGSDPAACIDMLVTAGALGLYGNTEAYLYAPDQEPNDARHRSRWSQIQPAVYWVRERLSAQQMGWLQSLPFERRFSPNGRASDDLLVVHANPRNLEVAIYPPPELQQALWGQVRQGDDDPALAAVLEGVETRTIAYGHFHYASQRCWRDKLLVGVGSCSLPGVDHVWRAHYTVFDWNGSSWEITPRQVDYDAEGEIAALQRSDLSTKEFFISYFG
jgi:predicted phosphodiesterase